MKSLFLAWFFIYRRRQLSVLCQNPEINHLVGIPSFMQQYTLEQLACFLLSFHGCLLFSRGGRPWPFENCWLQFAHHNFGSQRPIFTSHPVMFPRPASPVSLPKRGERQSSRLAEKSDDPLAEAATTAEIALPATSRILPSYRCFQVSPLLAFPCEACGQHGTTHNVDEYAANIQIGKPAVYP